MIPTAKESLQRAAAFDECEWIATNIKRTMYDAVSQGRMSIGVEVPKNKEHAEHIVAWLRRAGYRVSNDNHPTDPDYIISWKPKDEPNPS